MDAPQIDYRGELPPHRQIAEWILARIESGDLQPGQPVPSEKELVDTFGMARTTARRAIGWLREQGAIRTVRPRFLRRLAVNLSQRYRGFAAYSRPA